MTDRTCWSRVGRVLNFFMPRLRIVLPILAIVSIILSLIALWTGYTSRLNQLINYIVFVMGAISPLYIDKYVNSETFLTLPASSTEKNFALIIICYVLIPLTVYIPDVLVNILLSNEISFDPGNSLLSVSEAIMLALKRISTFLFPLSLCFMVVEISRSLRVIKGLIAGIIAPLICGSIAIVIIVIVNWCNGLSPAFSSDDTVMIYQGMIPATLSSIKYTVPVLMIFVLTLTLLGCRGISRRQM